VERDSELHVFVAEVLRFDGLHKQLIRVASLTARDRLDLLDVLFDVDVLVVALLSGDRSSVGRGLYACLGFSLIPLCGNLTNLFLNCRRSR